MAYSRNFKAPNYNNSEQLIKRSICDWIARNKGKVYMYPAFRGVKGQVYQSQYMPAGVPDLMVSWRGWFVAIEVKRPAGTQRTMLGAKKQTKGILSENQKRELEAIARSGGIAMVAYSLDDVIRVLKPLPPRKDASHTLTVDEGKALNAEGGQSAQDARQTDLEDFIEREKGGGIG